MSTLQTYLYDRLSTDKYGNWTEVFGEDLLREVCGRAAAEFEDWLWGGDNGEFNPGEMEKELDEVTIELDDIKFALQVLGLAWNSKDGELILEGYPQDPLNRLRP